MSPRLATTVALALLVAVALPVTNTEDHDLLSEVGHATAQTARGQMLVPGESSDLVCTERRGVAASPLGVTLAATRRPEVGDKIPLDTEIMGHKGYEYKLAEVFNGLAFEPGTTDRSLVPGRMNNHDLFVVAVSVESSASHEVAARLWQECISAPYTTRPSLMFVILDPENGVDAFRCVLRIVTPDGRFYGQLTCRPVSRSCELRRVLGLGQPGSWARLGPDGKLLDRGEATASASSAAGTVPEGRDQAR